MAGAFEDEVRAEIEALRLFRAETDARRGEDRKRADDEVVELDTLEWPQVKTLMSVRFETARLRNRLADAERRISELEQAVAQTR